jgi:hypothetical protein
MVFYLSVSNLGTAEKNDLEKVLKKYNPSKIKIGYFTNKQKISISKGIAIVQFSKKENLLGAIQELNKKPLRKGDLNEINLREATEGDLMEVYGKKAKNLSKKESTFLYSKKMEFERLMADLLKHRKIPEEAQQFENYTKPLSDGCVDEIQNLLGEINEIRKQK